MWQVGGNERHKRFVCGALPKEEANNLLPARAFRYIRLQQYSDTPSAGRRVNHISWVPGPCCQTPRLRPLGAMSRSLPLLSKS